MLFECLNHHHKLRDELVTARTRLATLEAETPTLRARLSDLIADEGATSKEIAAARDALPKHAAMVEAAREEILVLEDAVTKAHAAAVEAGRIQWTEAVPKVAADIAPPLEGLQEAAAPFLALAEDLVGRWQAYQDVLDSWSTAFPGVHRPAPLPKPHPSRALQELIGRIDAAAHSIEQIMVTIDRME
ncbi:MAG: hypothetical protein GXY07_12600 [Candidatus Hydrogenedentes bacterium]|nr:hypothetical protein [Candidatus Hydrogenedentota bacterium]